MTGSVPSHRLLAVAVACALASAPCRSRAEPTRASPADPAGALAGAVSNYFATIFQMLQTVADQHPTDDTFRSHMKSLMDKTPGVFGASLIDTNFVITKVYHRRDFLAVGYDLKKVAELDNFWKRMRTAPAPQLSEPGHGSILQPRLVAMRCPILQDGRLQGVVSVMIRTEAFLEAVGLDKFQAFTITCQGKPAEKKGNLPPGSPEVRLTLPSTEWVIQYQP